MNSVKTGEERYDEDDEDMRSGDARGWRRAGEVARAREEGGLRSAERGR